MTELDTWDSHGGKRDSNSMRGPLTSTHVTVVYTYTHAKWISESSLGCGYTVLPEVTQRKSENEL